MKSRSALEDRLPPDVALQAAMVSVNQAAGWLHSAQQSGLRRSERRSWASLERRLGLLREKMAWVLQEVEQGDGAVDWPADAQEPLR